MKINISIITVVRNDKKGLIETFKSIKSSLCDGIEWIVIDGNSCDGTVDFLEQLNNPYLTWISEQDKNMYEAMNKGVKIAKGNYLQFLNAGDTLLVNLQDLHINKEKKDLIFYTIRKIDALKEEIKWSLSPDFIEHLKRYPSVPHQSTFIRKKVFEKYGLYREDIKYLGDYEFFCRIIYDLNERVTYADYTNKTIVSFICNGVTFNYRLSLKLMNECAQIQNEYFNKVDMNNKLMYISKYILSFVPGTLKISNYMRKFIKH